MSEKLEENLTTLAENTRNLCNLIDDDKVKPSVLLDSVIAMWAIINLPEDYRVAGELLIKKCLLEFHSLCLTLVFYSLYTENLIYKFSYLKVLLSSFGSILASSEASSTSVESHFIINF